MPPAEALIECPDIPEPKSESADDYAAWGAEMIEQYTDCAMRHDALRRWHRRR